MIANLDSELLIGSALVYEVSKGGASYAYLPTKLDLTAQTGLNDLSITYWGIGDQFISQDDRGSIEEVGVVIAARVTPIVSVIQQQIITALRNDLQIANPQASTISLSNIIARPQIGTYRWGICGDGDQTFPSPLDFGAGFSFVSGWRCSFARFTGSQLDDCRIDPQSFFSVRLVGQAAFTGNPWIVRVTADLSRVWCDARGSIDRQISFEWHRLDDQEYRELLDRLIDQGTIQLTFLAGNLDRKQYDRQILELGKRVLEAVNGALGCNNDLVVFEPRAVSESEISSGFGSHWPWDLTINLAFGDQAIRSTPEIRFVDTVSFKNDFLLTLPVTLTIAVPCEAHTASHFRDLLDPSEGCVTSEKAERLSERIRAEKKRKGEAAARLHELLTGGRFDHHEYATKMSNLYVA